MSKDDMHEYEALFIRRLETLISQKKVSQREVSLSIGQSEGYIAKLTGRHNLPSMMVFFWICDYFDIHPKDFFDEGSGNPAKINSIIRNLKKLNDEQLNYLSALIEDLTKE